MPHPKKRQKVYTLYRWRYRRTAESERANPHADPLFHKTRGSVEATFHRYKDLVAYARTMAKAEHVPVTRWDKLFDWNLT